MSEECHTLAFQRAAKFRLGKQPVGVGQIKKFWTGKGNATKQEMVAEAVARLAREARADLEPNEDMANAPLSPTSPPPSNAAPASPASKSWSPPSRRSSSKL